VEVEASSEESITVARAKESTKVRPHLDGKQIVKTVFVPERLVNFVVK
jgi:hypothetical protein